MSNFFEQLQIETQAERVDLLSIPQIVRGATGDIPLAAYIAFLTEAYHHVKHTLPLLMACGSRIPMHKEWVREALAEYIAEETGHQEWILNDIAACGGDVESIRYGQPRPETELMVSYAYDTINRGNPIAFFGMVLVLEGTSIELATHAADAIRDSLELPKAAFSYLSSHGELDISHMRFFESLMNRLEDQADQQAVVQMARMMFRLYGNVFRSLPLD